MNKRNLWFGLLVCAAVTTITMVILSKNMSSMQFKALQLLRGNHSFYLFYSSELDNITTRATQATNSTRTLTITKPPEPTNRPLKCDHCFFSNFPNITQTPEVCSHPNGTSPPEMVMMITSSVDGFDRRQAIRETWASVTKNNTANIRHVFLLGRRKNETGASVGVREEVRRYGDMLVSDFVDSYGNLTYKTLVGFHYLAQHCGQAKFFLKTDEDMFILTQRVLTLAKNNEKTLETSLGGSCYQSGKPWRDPKTKYYASIRSYPQPTYPGFCSGTGYIGSLNVVRKVLETSPNIPFFHLEDVYLSLVLRSIGYKLTRYPGFAEGAGVCKVRSKAKSALTIHEISASTIRQFWAEKCGAD